MKFTIALCVAFLLLNSGCTTREKRYQIGSVEAARQYRDDAERTHAKEVVNRLSPGKDYDVPPKILLSRFPDHSILVKKNPKNAGSVVIFFDVGIDGDVRNPNVLGSPPSELVELSLSAITQWKFSPALKGGVAVQVRLKQEFIFLPCRP